MGLMSPDLKSGEKVPVWDRPNNLSKEGLFLASLIQNPIVRVDRLESLFTQKLDIVHKRLDENDIKFNNLSKTVDALQLRVAQQDSIIESLFKKSENLESDMKNLQSINKSLNIEVTD